MHQNKRSSTKVLELLVLSLLQRMGSIVGSQQVLATHFPLHWSINPIEIPGIWLHPDIEVICDINYSPLLQKVRDIIAMWRYRALTPLGRIKIINSSIISLVIYSLLCLPTQSDKFFADFKQITTDFIWKGKGTKIRYDKILQDYDEGGLRLGDLSAKDQALKASWYKRAINNPDSPIYYGLPIKLPIIWSCNTHENDFNRMKLPFLQFQVWQAWSKIIGHTPENTKDVLHQTLWYNNYILNNNKEAIGLRAQLSM